MQIKGTALAVMPGFISSKFGEVGYRRWMAAITPAARGAFDEGILPSCWYPLDETYTQPTIKMCELFYNGSLTGARELGCHSADHALNGVYRAFVRIGRPKFLVSRAAVILPAYFKPSAMESLHTGNGQAVIRITQFPEISEAVEHRIAGWMEKALEISGAVQPSVVITKSLAKGESHTEFMANWQ